MTEKQILKLILKKRPTLERHMRWLRAWDSKLTPEKLAEKLRTSKVQIRTFANEFDLEMETYTSRHIYLKALQFDIAVYKLKTLGVSFEEIVALLGLSKYAARSYLHRGQIEAEYFIRKNKEDR